MKIGVLIGIRNDGNRKMMPSRIDHCEAYTVYANGPFFDGDIFLMGLVFKVKKPTALSKMDSRAPTHLIDMTLDDVSIQSMVHHHGSFQVDQMAYLQSAKGRFFQSFLNGRNGVPMAIDRNYCKTHAIVGQTLIYL